MLFLNDVHNAVSKSYQSSSYLYFKTAFDSVPHTNLLIKLWPFAIAVSLRQWFKSYLTNRQLCRSIDDSTSKPLPVLSGVLQGSVFGNSFPNNLQ